MLFFLNLDGTVTRSDTDHVYQGQNKVANVELFTLISPAQAAIQVAFTLPNGYSRAEDRFTGPTGKCYTTPCLQESAGQHWPCSVCCTGNLLSGGVICCIIKI